MTKILVVSDDSMPSGYGRISMEGNIRLVKRGYNVMVVSVFYDGLLPATLDGQPLPYWVSAAAGKDWVQEAVKVIAAFQPDIVHVIQDAPYAVALRNAPIDWSRHAFMVTTPVDGAPIYAPWVEMLKGADEVLTISSFGVETQRKAGIESHLCRPGVDTNAFYALPDAQRLALRARLNIAPEAFVLMTAAQNQGRKDIPAMLDAFFRFAADKPTARYLLDMDATSPAGWDLPALCVQFGWDARKLIFRADVLRAGILPLRERFALADAHVVISHREGYGLPLVEAQACGVVSIALDYCSGPEICGDGKGVIIPAIDYTSVSTWGGALDKHPDIPALQAALQNLYDHPDERRAIAQRGMAWARQQSWDAAADAMQQAIERIVAKRASAPTPALIAPPVSIAPVTAPVTLSPEGIQQAEPVPLVEGAA